MSTRGLEIRPFALPHRVNVNSVRAWRQLRNAHVYFDAFFGGQYPGCSDFLALCVDDVGMRQFRGALPKNGGSAKQYGKESDLTVRHEKCLRCEVAAGTDE